MTVSLAGQLERVDDALENAPVVEKVLAEALSNRRQAARHADARDMGVRSAPGEYDRQIVAERRALGVRVQQSR